MSTRGTSTDTHSKRGLECAAITSTSYAEDGTAVREGTDHILLSIERTEVTSDGAAQ